jgi:DNA-binding SARP family transcriptional activator
MLKIWTLGQIEIWQDQKSLRLPPTRKSCSLLAYLITHRNQAWSRDHLANLYWGDRPEQKARRSLTTALWHIRRELLDEDAIQSNSATVQFNPQTDCWLDAEEFERRAKGGEMADLEAATQFYRGDFLDGLFDDWIINERYRLEEIFLDVLSRLISAYEQAGMAQAALQAAKWMIQCNPLREDAHQVAMRAYFQLGQRNQAVAQYQRCQEVMMSELAIEPAAETEELYQSIIKEHQAPDRVAETGTVSIGPPTVPYRNPLNNLMTGRFIGRNEELGILLSHWQETITGQGKLLLIAGEAGLGKTKLVEEFASRLKWQGNLVLSGRCFEYEKILPYQPIAEALQSFVSTLSQAELDPLPPWVNGEVARLVPSLSAKRPVARIAPEIDSEQERNRLYDAINRFLAHFAAQESLLLILEDLHWAGESTLALLQQLKKKLAALPVLLVATYRPEAIEKNKAFQELIATQEADDSVSTLRLRNMSESEVESMLLDLLGVKEIPKELKTRLYLATEGNPFLIQETVKSLFESGIVQLVNGDWSIQLAKWMMETLPVPNKLSETIRSRVARLGKDAGEVIRLATIIGQHFDFEVLRQVFGRGEETTLKALDDLLRRGLIEEVGSLTSRDYAFSHQLWREVIYSEMPGQFRQQGHRRTGSVIEQIYGQEAGELAGELATHFHKGGLPEKALTWSLRAAEQAVNQYAVEDAVSYYSQALSLARESHSGGSKKSEILQGRAHAWLIGGNFKSAMGDLDQALVLARYGAESKQYTQILLNSAECYLRLNDYKMAVAKAREARQRALKRGDKRSAGIALRFEGEGLRWQGDNKKALERHQQACISLADAGDVESLGWAHLSLACLHICGLGQTTAAAPHLSEAARLFSETGCLHGQIQTEHHIGNSHFIVGKLQSSLDAYERALQLVRRTGFAAHEVILIGELIKSCATIGDLTTAEKYANKCLRIGRQRGEIMWQAHASFWLGYIAYERGEFDIAQELVAGTIGQAESLNYLSGLAVGKTQLSLIYRELGGMKNCQSARRLAAEAYEAAKQVNNAPQQMRALSQWGQACLACGDLLEAKARSKDAIDFAFGRAVKLFLPETLYNHSLMLKACKEYTEAQRFLLMAHEVVMRTAEDIRDPVLKASYIANVRVNSRIRQDFQAFKAR